MKKLIFPFATMVLFVIIFSCLISNPKPDDCVVKTIQVAKISEGTSYDIVFHNPEGEFYYINRGLEQGLNLDSLNAKILNKTVTLHLAKILGGSMTSEHIAQLAIGDEIIFTEFKN